jgi:hypothetical protein
MNEKTFAAIEKLKEIELELHRLKNALEMANKALDAKREWVSLTDDQIKEIIGSYAGPIKGYTRALFDKIDAKLREKNSG